ncbi:hypothetical protein CO614_04445 [Lysobacteraceae bacterium NML120232]|nr:hypothetical protein CO614_04445 [Xanthomonadaceae bacterium NML120232]
MKNSKTLLAIALTLALATGCKADPAVAASEAAATPATPNATEAQAQGAALLKARAAFDNKDYGACAEAMGSLIDTPLGLQHNAAYTTARCLALAGQAEKALELLKRPEVPRLTIVSTINSDAALENVRALPGWADTYKQLQAREQELESKMDLALRDEIIKRATLDFELRQKLASEKTEELQKQYQENLDWVAQMLTEKGWPGISLVGPVGNSALLSILMGITGRADLRHQALALMEKADPQEFDPEDFVQFTDITLLSDGKKQRFGTVFAHTDIDKFEMHPVESESTEALDQLRLQYGLPPVEEYKQLLIQRNAGAKPQGPSIEFNAEHSL